tara:strand:+ start:16 stop:438 length:423 start_codon:yes stop_codon:yes gene_type:complete
MPDYSKCVIYTIKSGDGLYVGSTCNFNNRKYGHKYNIYNESDDKYNMKLYKTIRENDGAWDMQPHSQYPCKSKMEMAIEEERVRKELKADLNMNSCYKLDNERIRQRQNKKLDCECGGKFTFTNRMSHFRTKKHINYFNK